jgi:hypothetical protein
MRTLGWGNRGRVFLLDRLLAALTVAEAALYVTIAALALSTHELFEKAGRAGVDVPTVAFLAAPCVTVGVAGWLGVRWARRGLTKAERTGWAVCLLLTGLGLIPWTLVWLFALFAAGYGRNAHPC